MAKSLKFNLRCNGKIVRTIEELQENFDIVDVLNYFKDGLLLKWLENKGYEESKEVQKIQAESDFDVLMKLATIFNIDVDKNLAKKMYDVAMGNEIIRVHDEFESNGADKFAILDKFYNDVYDNLIYEIANSDKLSVIEGCMDELIDKFWDKNPTKDFGYITMKSYLPAMYLMANNNTRLYLKNDANIFNQMCDWLNDSEKLDKMLNQQLQYHRRETAGLKTLVNEGTKCIILSMTYPPNSAYNREDYIMDGHNRKYTYNDINKKFVVVDGLKYCAFHSGSLLKYMEV